MSRKKTQPQITEKPAYYLEWEASKVAPEIIEKNVIFVEGDKAYESLLWALGKDCRTNTGQLRQKYLYRYSHLYSGGWLCTTLDPFASFSRSEWGCLKPNQPKEKDGKLIKYEHPPQTPTRAFYLEIGEAQYQKISEFWEIGKNGDFWPWVQSQPSLPVVITEGAKKAGALLTAGYAAVALPGVNNGVDTIESEKVNKDGKIVIEKRKQLTGDLEILAQPGREIIIAFDEDSRFKTQKAVNLATLELGKALEAKGCRVTIACWDSQDGKGIDDWIAAKGEVNLHEMIGDRLTLGEFRERKIRKVRKFSQNANFLDFLRECELDRKLKYNLLSLEVELDGKQFDEPDWFYMWFCDTYSVEVSEKIFFQSVLYFAYNNRFHPVRDYLESVADLPPVDLDTAAARYFGLHDSISNIMLKRWLIGAVARVNRPGCKLQGALILYGDPGLGKSTFFEKLGGPYYGGDVDDIKGKDNLLKQHNYWLIECQEFDQITSKTQANALKSWITTDTDNIRPPYGRKASPHPRAFAIGGSVNGIEFLSDPTGSRRFWILDIGSKRINNPLLEKERDNLWAAAVQAFNAGERWHLNAQEETQIQDGNKRYEIADDWQSIVEEYLEHRNAVTGLEILTEALDFNEKDISRKETLRITNILTTLRWRKLGQRREVYEGRSRRGNFWIKGQIMELMESGKINPQANISEIKELDLNQLLEDDCLNLSVSTSPPDLLRQPDIDTLNANNSNGYSEVSIPSIPFSEKNQKPETPAKPLDKPEPETDPDSLTPIQEINLIKRELNLTTEELLQKAVERVGKSSFDDFSRADLINFLHHLRSLLP